MHLLLAPALLRRFSASAGSCGIRVPGAMTTVQPKEETKDEDQEMPKQEPGEGTDPRPSTGPTNLKGRIEAAFHQAFRGGGVGGTVTV